MKGGGKAEYLEHIVTMKDLIGSHLPMLNHKSHHRIYNLSERIYNLDERIYNLGERIYNLGGRIYNLDG